MTDYSELKRLAEVLNRAIAQAEHKPGEWAATAQSMGGICCPGEPFQIGKPWVKEEPWASFSYKRDSWLAVAAVNALPELLELIAESERLKGDVVPGDLLDDAIRLEAERDALKSLLHKFVDGEQDVDENQAERHMYFTDAQSLLAMIDGEIEEHTIVPDSALKAMHDERNQLKTENAGFKTGYEAYEQVVQGLKAENDRQRLDIEAWRLTVDAERASRDAYKAELERLQGPSYSEELAALRKDAERYRWLQHGHSGYIEVVEWIGPHATGMTGADLDALVDTAMSKAVQP